MNKVGAVEGVIPFEGHETWYRMVGGDAEGKTPLLCLHGGPGCPHDYLEPLEAIAETGRRVIFYDQLGCGNSSYPQEPDGWTMQHFIQELDAVRGALGLSRVHLLGQSWGGMLALDYLLGKPAGVESLILASSLSSVKQWTDEANRLRSELPPDVRAVLDRHEAAGTTDAPEYHDAMMAFYNRHVCRLTPWPECLTRAFEKYSAQPEVYFTMWGPSEFHMTGTLKDWDVTDRLGEIRVPTLITFGRYDESTPAIADTLQRGIPHARSVIFEHSAHASQVEEPDDYLRVLGSFLDEVERA
ncbi:MAG: proline iminopeptidase-family hydrolase [Kiritimatiellae bacterium]|nr:proline iminopeptidase-family hydrolase [Kiritimatiellia bacterium]